MIKNFLALLLCMFICKATESYAFWKTCIGIDSRNTSVWVVDPDIMGVKNHDTNEFVFLSIDCPQNNPYEHPFSRCANGCPLYPDNSIRIPSGKSKLCEGDIIFVYNKRCEVTHISKGKDR